MAPRLASRAEAMTRVTAGLIVFAALAFAALLVVYVQVLKAGTRQGDVRGVAWTEHARSAWRCNVLPLEVKRNGCLLKLGA
ncbi:MAG: hypothetical protein ABIR94_12105 [Rubrivivax sp.]